MIRYLEDLEPGERHLSPRLTVGEADIIEFAQRFDPQPMHTDPAAAARGPFGGLIASGWHTTALAMRLVVEARVMGKGDVLGLGVEKIQWPKPLRPGDTLQVEIEVTGVRVSESKPTHGVVHMQVTARNQHGEVVVIICPVAWVPRRPPPGD